jgi:hypothetical protein
MLGGAVLLVNTLRSGLGKAFILRTRFILGLLPAKEATGWARRPCRHCWRWYRIDFLGGQE